MTITRRVTNIASVVAMRRVDATGLAVDATIRVSEPTAPILAQRVGDVPTAAGLITNMVPDTTIDFGTSLHWGDSPIIWGKGRGQLTPRHTVRVTL